jgi:hypothetical protein
MIIEEYLIVDQNQTFARSDYNKVLKWDDDERLFILRSEGSKTRKYTLIEIKANMSMLLATGQQVEDMAFDLFHYELEARKKLMLSSSKEYDGQTCNIPTSWVAELASTWKDIWRALGEDGQAEYTFQAREMIEKMMKSE